MGNCYWLSPLLSPSATQYIQSVTRTFLYYAYAIDPTILPAINELASQQAQPTQNTLKKAQQLLDYMATYPNSFKRFHASNMILNVDSDAAYLVALKAKSHVVGYF